MTTHNHETTRQWLGIAGLPDDALADRLANWARMPRSHVSPVEYELLTEAAARLRPATPRDSEPGTLGAMTAGALIESARSETRGLREYLDREALTTESMTDEQRRWVSAYLTSIESRLIVAGEKVAS